MSAGFNASLYCEGRDGSALISHPRYDKASFTRAAFLRCMFADDRSQRNRTVNLTALIINNS